MEEQEKNIAVTNEAVEIRRLMELVGDKNNPTRDKYIKKVVRCYNFVEGEQWEGIDVQLLKDKGVPIIPVDRIGRNIDTIQGIRDNSQYKVKVNKVELGDDATAELLDLLYTYSNDCGNFEEAKSQAFFNMLVTGEGIRKVGYDSSRDGEIWAENVNVEDFYCSPTTKKHLNDIRWCCHHITLSWEDAISIKPEKAAEIESLKTIAETEWEKLEKNPTINTVSTNPDYSNAIESRQKYVDYIHIWEFWVKKTIPLHKIGYMGVQQVQSSQGVIEVPAPQVRVEDIGYEVKEGEQSLGYTHADEWWQTVIATGNNKSQGILLRQERSKYQGHPFIRMCAELNKDGRPVGFVEKAISPQQRINLAWAQKIAFNNMSIKSPLVVEGSTKNVDDMLTASKIGNVLQVPIGSKVTAMNVTPNVNLQSIEEGNVARQDMDFVASSSEPAMRGIAESGASGIRLAQQQSAAMTPLNKWVKAERESEKIFTKKVLEIIINEFQSEKMMRIIGEQKFQELATPKVNENGQIERMGLKIPLDRTITNYDVRISDQSINDLDKQQSFNAMLALSQNGILFDDEYKIKNSPIKNIDDALLSNKKARNDVIRQLQTQVQQLIELLGEKVQREKQDPKAQGAKGKSQSQAGTQAGKRSMIGGQNF